MATTMKDELARARGLARVMKMVASYLEMDAQEYDCKFPLEHAKRLKDEADSFLKLK